MWDQGSEGWDLDHSPEIRHHKPWDRDQKFFILGPKDQAVPFVWDQGPKFTTLLESRVRNLGPKWDQR